MRYDEIYNALYNHGVYEDELDIDAVELWRSLPVLRRVVICVMEAGCEAAFAIARAIQVPIVDDDINF